MSTTYTKSITSDFGGVFNSDDFTSKINADIAITKTLTRIDTTGDVIDIVFAEVLPGAELTIFNALITNYSYTPPTDILVNLIEIDSITTTSLVDIIVPGMSTIPSAGNYLITFSCEVASTHKSGYVYVSLYIDETKKSGTNRKEKGDDSHAVSLSTYITLDGSQTVSIRWKNSGQGVANIIERNMIIQRI